MGLTVGSRRALRVLMLNGPPPDSALWIGLAMMLTGSVIALVTLLIGYGFAP